MRVIATAGHVDHGKSTLVRRLTGMEPDRWAEERRRGMTIDLGFAWTTMPSGERLAFVDVPGHERFVGNMLAGVGPVPAVMFVVAADEGWQAQSAEHLAALDALGVEHGLLVVTRCDLAEPAATIAQARNELAGTSLAAIGAVTVSGHTGDGIDRLTDALAKVAAGLPAPDPAAPVRLWIDRVFTIAGAGTVVTGTLQAGTLRVGDELLAGATRVQVRGLQTLKERVDEIAGVARVAVNLRNVNRATLARGAALLTPDAWLPTSIVDVGLDRTLPRGREYTLHIGSADVRARVRPLSNRAARLTLAHELPLRIGDRALLRDPGLHEIVAGVQVLDVRPPALRRRGAAAARAAVLASGIPDAAALLRTHGLLHRTDLAAMGCEPATSLRPVAGDWFADPDHWARLGRQLAELVAAFVTARPLDGGLPVQAARRELGLVDEALVEALVRPPLTLTAGRIHASDGLPPGVAETVEQISDHLADTPFQAPDAEWLADHGIDRTTIAAAARANVLLHLGDGVALLPDAANAAADRLAELPQPFTASQARQALETTRRVAIPLLELLDQRGLTRRIDQNTRTVIANPRTETS